MHARTYLKFDPLEWYLHQDIESGALYVIHKDEYKKRVELMRELKIIDFLELPDNFLLTVHTVSVNHLSKVEYNKLNSGAVPYDKEAYINENMVLE